MENDNYSKFVILMSLSTSLPIIVKLLLPICLFLETKLQLTNQISIELYNLNALVTLSIAKGIRSTAPLLICPQTVDLCMDKQICLLRITFILFV